MSNRVKLNYIVREYRTSDCEYVRKLWSEAGFQVPLHINEVMMKIDPKGILVAQDADSGKIIGIINGINVSPDFAYIGSYIINSEYQGLGVGTDLWNRIIKHIGTERNIELGCGLDMWTKYRDKSGFRAVPENNLLVLEGKPNLDKLIDSIDGISLQSINEDNIESVIKYDTRICEGMDRTALIQQISKTPDSVNLIAINSKQEVLGYCALWVTINKTAVVEPLYADNKKIAELLVNKCCQLLPNTRDYGLIMYCWKNHLNIKAIADKMGLELQWEQKNLFTKKVITGDLDKIFIVSLRMFYPY